MSLKMFLFFLLLSLCSKSALSAQSECNLAQVCVSDLTDEDCAPGHVVAPNVIMGGCCPGCVIATSDENDGMFYIKK